MSKLWSRCSRVWVNGGRDVHKRRTSIVGVESRARSFSFRNRNSAS